MIKRFARLGVEFLFCRTADGGGMRGFSRQRSIKIMSVMVRQCHDAPLWRVMGECYCVMGGGYNGMEVLHWANVDGREWS